MPIALLAVIAQLAVTAPTHDTSAKFTGARHPAYAADGRLALAIHGDIWMRTDARWTQLTSGIAWDSDPAWSADGTSIIYSSTVSGAGDLYRVATSGTATPERLTTSDEPEIEPSIARDG